MLTKTNRTRYHEALNYLYGLQKFGIKFGLSQTVNLLRAFDNPHSGQRYIHIAGTNGKGSVAAMVSSILREAGLKVGFYSSPHLVRFTERFRVNGEEMAMETAAGLIEELQGVIAPDEPPTFFEVVTAMALIYFAREKTDIAVMEVGMGGRLDATNVIQPLISVITNISLEHQSYLGTRLLDIAGEKAGIIKEGTDVLTGVTQPSLVRYLEEVCRQKRAPLWRLGKEIRYRMTRSGINFYGVTHPVRDLQLGLRGKFQGRNAALALAAVERLAEKGIEIPAEAIREGMRKVSWPGRLQVVSTGPTIILDGAHNPDAMRMLADTLQSGFPYRRLLLVIGVMADKDIPDILRQIVPISDYVIYTRPLYPRAADPEVLMAEGKQYNKPGELERSLHGALDRVKDLAGPEDLVIVCGSLFTVGEALTYFDPASWPPETAC